MRRILYYLLLASLLLIMAPGLATAMVGCSTEIDSSMASRILIIIAETSAGNQESGTEDSQMQATTAEISVMDVLMKEGFVVIDPGVVRQQLKRNSMQALLQGDERTLTDVAQQFNAKLMILGKASASVATGISLHHLKSCQATVQVRAVKATTGIVIATAFATSAKPHVDAMIGSKLAIQEAAAKTAKELSIKLRKVAQE